jgi:excisionase family DNA binding protein
VGADNLLTLHEVAERLGVHYMTAYRYVRTGRLPAHKQGPTWMVAPGDLAAFTTTAAEAPPRRGSGRAAYPLRLEDRLVHGDEAGAWTVIDGALGTSLSPEQIYTDVLAPAMASIGDRWSRHELEIEDEHLATSVALRLIGRLGPRFSRRGRKRGTVVLGAPAGDAHGIPVLMVGDLLRSRGFDVIDLGANTPPTAFARAVSAANDVVAVGLCATCPDNDQAVADAVGALVDTTTVPVVLGGNGVTDSTVSALPPRAGNQVHRTRSTDEALAAFDAASRVPPSGRDTTAAASHPDPHPGVGRSGGAT